MSVLNRNNEDNDRIYSREGKILGVCTESQSDYVLPDYMGDVKRLLKYSASVVPCNKFVSGGEVSFLSAVNFKIVYLDSENIITEASFSTDFEHSEKLPEGVSDACVATRVNGVTVRLGGPRKISARASLVTDISFTEQREMPALAAVAGAVEKHAGLKIHTAEYLGCDEREYAEELDRFEDLSADEVDVIKYDARAYVDSVHKTDSGVNVSGALVAWCILRVGEDVMRVEKSVPIEESLEIEGACESSVYVPHVYVTDANINMNVSPEDKDGATFLSVVMNMTLECEIEHHKNEEYGVISDAFYENAESVCGYGEFAYNELVGSACERRKVSLVTQRGEENLHDIVERDALLRNVKYEALGTEVKVSADLCVTLVCRGADDGDFFPVRLEEHVEQSLKLPAAADESARIRVSATPCEISPAFDGDKIYVDCTLCVLAVAEVAKKERILTTLERSDAPADAFRRITVYYPEKKDTLWSVSKKYGVSPERVARCNMLQIKPDGETSLAEVKKIVIA